MPILPNNTLSSIVNLVNRADQDSVVKLPLSNAAFTLDSSGVAGFFGGESAVRAMSTVNLVHGRRWFGWYNSPGSYEVAKQYSKLANSSIFDAIFPGDDSDPAKILMVDGRVGPEHTLLYFPSKRAPEPIGHLGSLIARKVSQMPTRKDFPQRAKHTMNARVTFVKLNRIPGELDELELSPSESNIFAISTILISVGGCVACALVADWFCLASIALGIIANGVACLVIGSGKPYLKHNPPAQDYAPGDVVLRTETDIIVLFGVEGAVSPFTRARFLLRFGGTSEVDREQEQSGRDAPTTAANCGDCKGNIPIETCKTCNRQHICIPPGSNSPTPTVSWKPFFVDISVVLLLSQFLAQLLLIPQGTLFGQIMFIGTLVPSWMYHSYLSSLSLDLQTNILFDKLSIQKDDIYRYQLNTWTEAVVFTALAFREIHSSMSQSVDALQEAVAKPDEEVGSEVEAEEEADDEAPENAGKESGVDADAPEKMEAELAAAARELAKAEPGAEESEGKTPVEAKAGLREKDVSTAEKKSKHGRRSAAVEKAKVVKKEKEAFQALLDVLLPGKTVVWQALKESLGRKLGATNNHKDQIKLQSNNGFVFRPRDSIATMQDVSGKDSRRRVGKADQDQLRTYQEDAESALVAWRQVRAIANKIRNHE